MTLTDAELCSTFDGRVWASEFVARFGGDEDLMLVWFANAIMAGHDIGRRNQESELDRLRAENEKLTNQVRELEADKRRLEEQLRDAYNPIRKVERRLEAEANNWDVLPCGHRGYVVLIEGTDGRYCKSICDECGADAHPEIATENGPSRE